MQKRRPYLAARSLGALQETLPYMSREEGVFLVTVPGKYPSAREEISRKILPRCQARAALFWACYPGHPPAYSCSVISTRLRRFTA